MEFGFSFGTCFKAANPPLLIFTRPKNTYITLRSRNQRFSFRVSAVSYNEFAESALEETRKRVVLEPSPLQERYSSMTGLDGKTQLQMLAFKSPKVRLLRSMTIENETMQVFDFAGFMKPEYDTPIFCANFFTSANMNIVVLDLNPLHQLTDQTDYQDKFPSSHEKHKALFSAFLEYYQAWIEMTIQVKEEMEPSQTLDLYRCYSGYCLVFWQDPGHALLRKLVGEAKAKALLRDFLFNGVDELGTKTFIDYFPEYQKEGGTVSDKRSIIGKSFETRPWDSTGRFIG
ncbi:hypothetical protein Bca101_084522 [Brassica carinata]